MLLLNLNSVESIFNRFCAIAIIIQKFLAAAGTIESWLTEKQEGIQLFFHVLSC